MTPKISFPIESSFLEYIPEALTRLSYLHPTYSFTFIGTTIEVLPRSHDKDRDTMDSDLQADVYYQVYRARIAKEGSELRERLYNAVFSK